MRRICTGICTIISTILLSACTTIAPTEPAPGRLSGDTHAHSGVPAKTNGGAPDLPSNYRNKAAIYVVSEYIQDASGPPEISEPVSDAGPFGGSTRAIIRFPVSAQTASKKNIVAFVGAAGPYYRCASISAYSGISSLGKTELTVRSSNVDTPECGRSLKFSRYSELENLAAQCRIPGAPCRGETVVTYTLKERKSQ